MVDTGMKILAESRAENVEISYDFDVWITTYKLRELKVIQERQHWRV